MLCLYESSKLNNAAGKFALMSKRKSAVTVPFGLGARIKAAREIRGFTQPELGKMVGVSKSAVNQWENGLVQNLKLGNLFAVAQALNKDVKELVFGDGSVHRVAEPRPTGYAEISPEQLALISMYADLPKSIQRHIRGLITALVSAAEIKR